MVKVRAIKPHNNSHGDTIEKKEGAEYEIASEAQAVALVEVGLVEIVKDDAAPGGAPGSAKK